MPLFLFVIVILLLILLWNLLKGPVARWVSKFIAHRTEDAVRRMMGMPTRKEEQKRRKEAEKRARRGKGGASKEHHPAVLMKRVAEDVEYTEFTEYERTEIIEDDGKTRRVIVEEQISDAEYIEIK